MKRLTALTALPLTALALAAAPAVPALAASGSGSTMYMATLKPLNNQHASGTLMLRLNGNSATITEHVTGLASTFSGSPFPHVQHIHGLAKGSCPTSSADSSGDGVISTVEGAPSYGAIQTTLSVSGSTAASAGTDIKIAPSGSSFDYSRTISLNADTMKAIQGNTAVIVVHGDDPTLLPKAAQSEKSALVPSLPLAATAPALCGTLVASQMSAMPSGGAATGGGSTAGLQDTGLLALGGALLVGASGVAVFARRRVTQH